MVLRIPLDHLVIIVGGASDFKTTHGTVAVYILRKRTAATPLQSRYKKKIILITWML